MEYDALPDCCKRSMALIHAKLEIAKLLPAIVKISPDVAGIPFTIMLPFVAKRKVAKALWGLAKMGYKYNKFRRETHSLMGGIVVPSIKNTIFFECQQHQNTDLEHYWENVAEGLNVDM